MGQTKELTVRKANRKGKAEQHKEKQACLVTEAKERGRLQNDRVKDRDEESHGMVLHGHLARRGEKIHCQSFHGRGVTAIKNPEFISCK